ncbi:SusC/RagA family TonB-linked outer membrane protein [Larkinella sp. VNQ87]|uniref:SusC/RagA family TonB-linked outer membrane protein n=1 Tax=Larkinella sp. VNQ87 TaxID=3400921 RepID=UPI003C03DD22
MTTNSIVALAGSALPKWSVLALCLALWSTAFAGNSLTPKRVITGKVTDSGSSEPLPGVNIVVEGTTQGTVTNAEGQYSIDVSKPDAVLIFSYVGYKLEKIPVSSNTVIDVKLTADDRKLDEIIVVGYGSQKKSDITGAISSITTKALKEVPVTNAPQMLQGRVAGAYVLTNSNKPGGGVSVQIRGRRSFNAGNDPLYVVDGIPISGGFNDINPGDIESMEILKDASATAIYGSRGANGVIIITTRRGKVGKPTVSYDTYLGTSRILRYADVMNGAQFAEYKRESRRAVINTATGRPLYDDADPQADAKLFEAVELESIAQGRSTDWQRLMVKNGSLQNHELGISGGSDNTRYNVAVGYFKDIGIIPGQDFTRYTTRINLDQTLSKRFKAGTSTLGSYSERNGEDVNPYGQGADFGALSENPLGRAYDDNGELIFLPTSDGLRSNPLSELVPGAVINKSKRFRLLSNLYGEAELIDGLRFRMNFAPDLTYNKKGDFRGRYTNVRRLGDPAASSREDFTLAYTWENILTYKKQFGAKHSLDFTGLYSLQTRRFEQSFVNVSGLPVESFEYFNVGAASVINGVSSGYEKWSILSYMARINYAFDNRFLLTLTGRADGSSKFAEGKKWGYFPSAALAWNVTNERFMTGNPVFTSLKFRVSYGATGNEGIPPYQTNGLLVRSQYDFDGSPAFGYRPSSIRNSDLRWETTATFNAGIDFGILNNRITGALEVYQSKTTDLLLPKLLPITSGFASVLSNVGSKRNRGVEFSVSTLNVASKQAGGFEWSTDLNLFTNREEILELSQGKVDDIGNLRFIGQPAVVYYDFVKTGIWQLGEESQARQLGSFVGGIKVQDVNGNGVIDPADRQILGSDVPRLVGGMTHRFEYKGFDLSVLTFARFGSLIQSPFHGSSRYLSGRVNMYNVDYWTPTNPTNAYPRPNVNQEQPTFGSTLSYFDGSFTKIRNINLGYNVPAGLAQKLRMQSLRLYVSVQNPFVFSTYTAKHNGIDPEFPTNNTPPVRTFLAGLNVKF